MVSRGFLAPMLDQKVRHQEVGDFPGCPVVDSVLLMQAGEGSVPGWGTRIPHAMQHGQKKKEIRRWVRAAVFLPNLPP